ncbi:helix-turn-helix domain-containing protein [Streptomyces cacaoi]|uniref:HTH cro/C1-type domain-containing protein n=1 Tax=Streptomyces cacaoi TaxID=1898 RepID=A0A4Y3QWL8_STRCI|nr:XRE family transcriptional regulator [Streptomyces cacaoi]NNG87173.1 DUF2690 domain-containing protein [Streptomyces cacaoi]GEB49784.1 hypothetical protein SCA03_23350 [Streptomyces cacaoi]
MSDWKALPEALELDVRRLVEELRRAKDAAGLTLAQLATVTAYSKSSWERCLNGSQLPPRRAVETLAVRAGTDPLRMVALWELAETARNSGTGTTTTGPGGTDGPGEPGGSGEPDGAGEPNGAGGSVGTGRSTEPGEPVASSGPGELSGPREPGGPGEPDASVESGASGASGASGGPVQGDCAVGANGSARGGSSGGPAEPGRGTGSGAGGPRRRPGRRNAVLVAGAFLVVVGATVAFAVTRDEPSPAGGGSTGGTAVSKAPVEDVEARCHGDSCNGKDPVDKGCGGDAWTSAAERAEESYVEVRYSSACRAAWARIKSATPGDRVELVREDGRTYDEVVPDDANRAAFTFMLGAPIPRQVKACWELESGDRGCTKPGGDKELPAASPVPS